MSYNCEVKEQSAQQTVYVSRRTPVQKLSQVLGEVYGKLEQYLDDVKEKPAGPPFVAYRNMDMTNLDCEIGFPVAKKLTGKGEVKAGVLPAGTIVSCVYTGPYDKISSAYEELNHWIVDHHYQVAGAAYEMYLNSPTETPQSKLQTRIVFPVKAA